MPGCTLDDPTTFGIAFRLESSARGVVVPQNGMRRVRPGWVKLGKTINVVVTSVFGVSRGLGTQTVARM